MGDSADLAYKLKEAKKVIAQEDETDPKQIGEINLSIAKKVYVEPLETLEKTTAAPKKEVTTVPETTAVTEPETEPEDTQSEEETEPEEEETTIDDISEDE